MIFKNRVFLIKSIFYLFVGFLYIALIFSTLLITFEFLGISKFINQNIIDEKNEGIYELRETDYYKKGGLLYDPYTEFIVQVLHPTYFFSSHWNIEKIKKFNNPYVSLKNSGFRNSLKFENKKDSIILLGGSTAFGHGSSSDNTTVSSLLSKKSKYNSVNNGLPSWNSHQEML